MSRRTLALSLERPGKPALLAGGILALTLVAGCGSSGSGTVAGDPPTAPPTATSTTPTPAPTEFPGPSSSPTTASLRDFEDATSGISLRIPPGYVLATTPAQAASRFPKVLGGSSLTASKIKDAQDRLSKTALMIAFHAPIDGQFDNIGITRSAVESSAEPEDVQTAAFATSIRQSLTGVGASLITVLPIDLDGVPAAEVTYRVKQGTQLPVYGRQIYVVRDAGIYITTVTAGTAARAKTDTDYLLDHWTFS